MSEFILHHYPMSPFAHKTRVALGYTQLPWLSATTKEMPPRPALEHLAGGYRKIPVAQIGADVFCDTKIIFAEIAALSNKPELDLENCSPAVQDFIANTDGQIFMACVGQSFSWKLGKQALKDLSFKELFRLLKDRANIARTAKMRVQKPAEAQASIKDHIKNLEGQLTQSFLGGDTPNAADFSAYHSLWFLCDLAGKKYALAFPKVTAWMQRMAQFGDGNRTEIDAASALDRAFNSEPRTIADEHKQDPLIGKKVSIAPTDYGLDATQGELAGCTESRWIIARDDNRVGRVHVHFPKNGFAIKAI